MSEHRYELPGITPEEVKTTSITLWQNPYAVLPAEIDDLEEELMNGFGIDIWEDERREVTVYEIDCPKEELEAVSELLREKGYWFMVPVQRKTYRLEDLAIEQVAIDPIDY